MPKRAWNSRKYRKKQQRRERRSTFALRRRVHKLLDLKPEDLVDATLEEFDPHYQVLNFDDRLKVAVDVLVNLQRWKNVKNAGRLSDQISRMVVKLQEFQKSRKKPKFVARLRQQVMASRIYHISGITTPSTPLTPPPSPPPLPTPQDLSFSSYISIAEMVHSTEPSPKSPKETSKELQKLQQESWRCTIM